MNGRRVAVTGLGALCALGQDVATIALRLAEGVCGIRPLTSLDTSELGFDLGAEVQDFDPSRHFERRTADMLDRFSQLLVVASREAVAAAGIDWSDELRSRTAVVTGSCLGGQSSQDRGFVDLYQRGRSRVHPFSIPRIMANAGASHVSMNFGITGPGLTLSTACASSAHAIGLAFWMVRQGSAELALAGGSEAPFSFGNLKAWEAMRVVSPEPCRPFSRDRRGMSLGEGAAMLVLEPLERALERGAPVLAELVGFGMSSDAEHITQPSAAGAARAMRAALEDGNLDPKEVGYINAHGTGTLANDSSECDAVRRVFGDHADHLALSSTKSMHGHALGAAGGLEAVATVLALDRSILPPTIHFTEADPDCALDVVPNEARPARVGAALSNSFAFGGLNGVLAFRRAGS